MHRALISRACLKSSKASSTNTWRESSPSTSKRFSIKLTTKTPSTSKIWLVNTLSNCNCYNLDKSQPSREKGTDLDPPATSFCLKGRPKVSTSRSALWASQTWSRCTSIFYTKASLSFLRIEFWVFSRNIKRLKIKKERRRKKGINSRWWWRSPEAETQQRKTSLTTKRWLMSPRRPKLTRGPRLVTMLQKKTK